MAKDAVMHVRIDADTKEKAEQVYAGMGTSLSEAVRIFMNESIRANGFPFRMTEGTPKGQMKAKGMLQAYNDSKTEGQERLAWIQSLSDKYEAANR